MLDEAVQFSLDQVVLVCLNKNCVNGSRVFIFGHNLFLTLHIQSNQIMRLQGHRYWDQLCQQPIRARSKQFQGNIGSSIVSAGFDCFVCNNDK
jgi:hypothetical protein